MRKCYTRPCNFYYGNYAKKLIKEKKALSLTGRSNIAFDQVEIFHRNKKQIVESKFYSIKKLKQLDKETLQIVKKDLKNITHERKSILRLKFDVPMIMGALNIPPDSFSDGGLFFDETKEYDQDKLMKWLFSQKHLILENLNLIFHDEKIVAEKKEFNNVSMELRAKDKETEINIYVALSQDKEQLSKIKANINGDILTSSWNGNIDIEMINMDPMKYINVLAKC